MNIENNAVFAARETVDTNFTFEYNDKKNILNPIKFVINTILDDENLYEEICSSFDDEIKASEFQTMSSTLSASTNTDNTENPEDNKFSNLLDFVEKNKETIKDKLNDESKYRKEEKTPDKTPSKEPALPEDFDFSKLTQIKPTIYKIPEINKNEENPISSLNINEEIEASKQGNLGDCWFLAGLNSLSYSKNGKQIIKDAITNNGNGTYTVHFKGISDTCQCIISEETLKARRASGIYSTGDDDVLLLEIATEAFLRNLQEGNVPNLPDDAPEFLYDEQTNNPLDGGFPADFVYLLTGKNMDYQNIVTNNAKYMQGEALEEFYNNLDDFYAKIEQNPDSSCACLHIKKNDKKDIIVQDIYGNNVILTKKRENHSLSVKSINKDTITLVNPWDSSSEYTIKKDVIKEHILGFEYLSV